MLIEKVAMTLTMKAHRNSIGKRSRRLSAALKALHRRLIIGHCDICRETFEDLKVRRKWGLSEVAQKNSKSGKQFSSVSCRWRH